MAPVSPDTVKEMYDRVCESYHAIDEFWMKLLGLLPLATGTGVFLLLSGKAQLIDGKNSGQLSQALGAIGIFGALFTLDVFTYELFGIKKCHYLIEAGRRLEIAFGIRGQFRTRPRGPRTREAEQRINNVLASALHRCGGHWTGVSGPD